MKKNQFSPVIFLASLGAGGIAVMPFALLQYSLTGIKGLVTRAFLGHGSLPLSKEIFYYSLEGVMVVFTMIHIVLTILFLRQLVTWLRQPAYRDFVNNPLKNAGILTPFLSLAMTMNVFIGPIRFFFPSLSSNLQTMMLPALIGWGILWALLLRMEIKLLKISFINSFDVSKISFGWLLHPFTLGMVTVTGTGIAAMAKNPTIAHTAAFMSLISGTMGFFLLIVKLITIFKSHFAADGLPEKQFLPSFLIVVPNITLYALSAYRLGHYMNHQFGAHMHTFEQISVVISYAFEVWYLIFGIALLKDYLKKDFFKKEFYLSQWGFVCPFVAFGVLGSFFYGVTVQSPISMVVNVLSMVVASGIYFLLLKRQLICSGVFGTNKDFTCIFDQPEEAISK